MTTVLICDDSRPSRDGLCRHVAEVPGVDHVSIADSPDELIRRWAEERPQLVLLSMGASGVATTKALLTRHPDANVIVISGGDDDRESAAQAIASGARGFLVRDVSYHEVCAAVANALAFGGPRTAGPQPPADMPGLTERELQVLEGMSQGKSNNEIGRHLYLSEDTVKTHARRLFRKMGVNDRAQAVALGFRWGLVH